MTYRQTGWLLLCTLLSLGSPAWDRQGHANVARIASAHLDTASAQEVQRLLAADSDAADVHELADIASWADHIKRYAYGRERAAWHYEDMPVCSQSPAPCPQGRCLDTALHQQLQILADRKRSLAEREIALKWVVHLVADLHQPLHVSDDDDAGGNRLQVRLREQGRPHSLHWAWDHAWVDAVVPLTTSEIGPIDDDIEAWIAQSHELGVRVAYGDLPGFRCGAALPQGLLLDTAYQDNARHVVALQIQRAGLRLAHLLNDTLAPVGKQP